MRYGIEAENNLPDLKRRLGRWSSISRIKIYNVDRMMKRYSNDKEVMIDQLKDLLVEGFSYGRKARVGQDGKSKKEEKMDDVEIIFRTSLEYLEIAERNPAPAIDELPKKYWDILCRPSAEIVELRNDLLRESRVKLERIEVYDAKKLLERLRTWSKRGWIGRSGRLRGRREQQMRGDRRLARYRLIMMGRSGRA